MWLARRTKVLVKNPKLTAGKSPNCSVNGRKPVLARLLHYERHDRPVPASRTRRSQMNVKTTIVSALAALFVSTIAVGSAVAPATAAAAAPIKIAQYA